MKKISKSWKKELKRLWWLLLIPAALILKLIAENNPDLVQKFYTQGIFEPISNAVAWAFGWMPFSFAEFLVYAILAGLAAFIIVQIVRAAKRKFSLKKMVHGLIIIGIIFAVGLNAFYFMWGFNYYAYSVAPRLGLQMRQHSPQELADLCVALAAAAEYLRPQLNEDENGVYKLPEDVNSVLQKIPKAYAELGEEYPEFSREIPAPKPVLASELMSYAGISGIFIPFTEEANVNVHQHDLMLASSAAHESAHLLGVAREDEANFVSFLACLKSDDLHIAYSGIMLALVNAGNALYDISKEAYGQLYASYSDELRRDLDSHRDYWDLYEGQTQETVEKINDTYLKQHSQSDGVQSYGRMVDLLLAYFDRLNAQAVN